MGCGWRPYSEATDRQRGSDSSTLDAASGPACLCDQADEWYFVCDSSCSRSTACESISGSSPSDTPVKRWRPWRMQGQGRIQWNSAPKKDLDTFLIRCRACCVGACATHSHLPEFPNMARPIVPLCAAVACLAILVLAVSTMNWLTYSISNSHITASTSLGLFSQSLTINGARFGCSVFFNSFCSVRGALN